MVLSNKIKLNSMKNSFYKLLLIFSVKDIRWSLPMDRELDNFFIGDGAGVGKGRQVSIFRICTISCCYYTWSMNSVTLFM